MFGFNPSLFRTSKRYPHSTLLKAFSPSNDRIAYPLTLFLANYWLNNLRVLWNACLPSTNLFGQYGSDVEWFLFFSICQELLQRTLVSLDIRDMGWYDALCEGDLPGFNRSGIAADLNSFFIEFIKHFKKMCQQFPHKYFL